MAEATAINEQPNSCKIAVNAKGLWSGEIKVYASTITEAMVTAEVKADVLAGIIASRNK